MWSIVLISSDQAKLLTKVTYSERFPFVKFKSRFNSILTQFNSTVTPKSQLLWEPRIWSHWDDCPAVQLCHLDVPRVPALTGCVWGSRWPWDARSGSESPVSAGPRRRGSSASTASSNCYDSCNDDVHLSTGSPGATVPAQSSRSHLVQLLSVVHNVTAFGLGTCTIIRFEVPKRCEVWKRNSLSILTIITSDFICVFNHEI